MEGSLVNLPHVLELKRRYKVSLDNEQKRCDRILTNPSSTYTLMRPTLSVLLDPMDEECATISVSTHGNATF